MAEPAPIDAGADAADAARRRETERLGSDPIARLVLRLSLPALLGLLASSLYTFVDRVFIGNYVGEIGLAAMNAAIPFNTLIFAFSILIGRGCAVLYSLALGRRVLPLPVPWTSLAQAAFASAIMAVAVIFTPALGGLAELLLKAGVGAAVYLGLVLAIDAGGLRSRGLPLIRRFGRGAAA